MSTERRRVSARSAVQPSHGRGHNLSVALQALHTHGPMSRADLARHVGLTKVTASTLVSELLAARQAVEIGTPGPPRPGKPSTLVDINRHGLQVIGIDLTDHLRPRSAVLDLDGRILARSEVVIEGGGSETDAPIADADLGSRILAAVLDLARNTLALATQPVLGIGVGTPGIVAPGGIVQAATNLGWHDVRLGPDLAAVTGLSVTVSNDADAAVHAEHTLGAAGDHVVLVKLDRGVGCGVIVGGQRVRGARFAAGEFGHVTVDSPDGEPGELCRCGKVGCLETWLSTPHLERALAEGRESSLRHAGERLGIALAPIVAMLDLGEVLLSGPEHLVAGPLRDAVADTLSARLLSLPGAAIPVRVVEAPADIVLRGATALVLNEFLGVT